MCTSESHRKQYICCFMNTVIQTYYSCTYCFSCALWKYAYCCWLLCLLAWWCAAVWMSSCSQHLSNHINSLATVSTCVIWSSWCCGEMMIIFRSCWSFSLRMFFMLIIKCIVSVCVVMMVCWACVHSGPVALFYQCFFIR